MPTCAHCYEIVSDCAEHARQVLRKSHLDRLDRDILRLHFARIEKLVNGRAHGDPRPGSDLSQEDYPSFPEFRSYQIPLTLVSAELILVLQQLRTDSGIPIIPSPVHAGWARIDGSPDSRHYAVGRLSDAGDIFPARGRAFDCWLLAQEISRIGALGLYGDTRGPDGRPWTMMHIDLRPRPRLFWIREDGKYYYLHRDPVSYWRAFKYLVNREGIK